MVIALEAGESVLAVVMHDKSVVYSHEMTHCKSSDDRVFLQTQGSRGNRYEVDAKGIIVAKEVEA